MELKFSKLWMALPLLALLAGCPSGPGSPAAPPGPPAEIPSALRFPENLSGEFDLNTVAAAGTGMLPALSIGDDISGEISDTAQNFQVFAGLVDNILGPLHQLLIPMGPDVTHFEDLMVLGDDLVNVKIDFGAFDEDGDGKVEPCSGNTASLPICYRIWFDGQRALSGIFLNAFPTEDNSGDGRFRGLSPVKILDVIPFVASVSYDVRDPEDKKAEYFIGLQQDIKNDEPFVNIPPKESDFGATLHLSFTQSGPEASAVKTILGSIRAEADRKESHIGRWQEGTDFWSGSRDLTDDSSDFLNACALISSGLVIETQQCIDAGVDVGGVDFLEFLKIEDVAFPDQFTPLPTF